jgi:hypothetical protein
MGMDVVTTISTRRVLHGRRQLAAMACALALPWIVLADRAGAEQAGLSAATAFDSASLVQCLTAGEASERAAVFAGEMTAIAGTSRMAMRVELLERTPGETGYRPVLAPGVGAWHYADPEVKSYKHIEQFTNLSAPAYYRALISFRWEGSHGRVVKRDEQRSPRCQQSAPAPPTPPAPLE